MRCCVPGCKNDSRHLSKSQGITFHVFPTEAGLRSSWLRAVGKERWEPRERSAVCSAHFLLEDLYHTRRGLRKVRAGAVPVQIQDMTCDYGETASLQACRVCLRADGALQAAADIPRLYTKLTGLAWTVEGVKVSWGACGECGARVRGAARVWGRAHRAHGALTAALTEGEGEVTIENIRSIDREGNQLCSSLTAHHVTDHYDYNIEHEDLVDCSDLQPDITIHEVEVKQEPDNIYLNEDFDDNIEQAMNPITDDDALDHGDKDFVASDRDYSTDDSLPLGKRKKKEKKTKKKREKKESKKVKKKPPKQPAVPKIDRRRKPLLNAELNETLFSVTELSVEEQLAEIDKRRHSANYMNAVYKCTHCYKGFLDHDAYNTHLTRHTTQCGEYACNICKTHFKQPHALRKHVTAHHTQRFSCNQCPYVTTHRQTARLHERWHKGTKYQCPHCPEEFVKFTTYMGHVRIKHPSDFVCELCGYSFVSAKGIQLHKQLKHRSHQDRAVPAEGPYCEPCAVRFVSSDAHRRHLRHAARHRQCGGRDDDEPSKPRKGRKTKEMKDAEGGECDKNGDTEADKKKVYPSQLRKAEGPIPCEQSYALLKDHRWTHLPTGERPFACSSCGKRFRMRQRLVAHRRVHAQHRPHYVCGLCGKGFSTHSNRQRHMFIHTGLKPFSCEMCGKSFKHASEKRAHVTYVHLKKPWPKRSRAHKQNAAVNVGTSGVGASETASFGAAWPCEGDGKMADVPLVADKPIYYNVKI